MPSMEPNTEPKITTMTLRPQLRSRIRCYMTEHPGDPPSIINIYFIYLTEKDRVGGGADGEAEEEGENFK